jgi:endonuclease/exonuclease/phosphatase family metal-dependent hydrolase
VTDRLLVAMLAAVVANVGLAHYYEPQPPPPAPPADSVRVMTFNIHQYYASGQTGRVNLEAIRDVIRATNATVIGLQESEGGRITSGHIDGLRWLADELGFQAYHGPPTRHQVYGVGLLSRYPIENASWHPLPARQSIERVAILAELQTPVGRLVVLNTHFQTVNHTEDRVAQAQRVIELLAPHERAVVLGDFNTPANATDPAYVLLQSAFADAWVAAGHEAGSGATELDESRPERIDHVWLKGAWEVRAAATAGGPEASDHLAVWAEAAPR